MKMFLAVWHADVDADASDRGHDNQKHDDTNLNLKKKNEEELLSICNQNIEMIKSQKKNELTHCSELKDKTAQTERRNPILEQNNGLYSSAQDSTQEIPRENLGTTVDRSVF